MENSRQKTSAELHYADIIDRPRPKSPTRPHMSNYDRAAQFSPFAALTGYEAAVEETARLTDEKIELTEDQKYLLDEKLRMAIERGGNVRITYFISDRKKAGGAYEFATGQVKEVDTLEHSIVLTDKRRIPLDDLWDIEWDQ